MDYGYLIMKRDLITNDVKCIGFFSACQTSAMNLYVDKANINYGHAYEYYIGDQIPILDPK